VTIDPKNFPFLLKKFKNKPSVNWNTINYFCDLVSFDQLDTECKIYEVERKGARKPMEFASAREDWFATKTKALFELKQYQECFELSKKALELFDKFHYSNEVWFARRIALSKKHLGKSEDALNELLSTNRVTFGDIKNTVRSVVSKYYFRKTQRNPMIIPLIMNRNY